MVESGSLEVSEDTVVEALEFAHAEIRKIVAAIRDLQKRVNPTKAAVKPPAFDEALYKELKSKYEDRLRDALDTQKHPKNESYGLVDAIKAEIKASIPEDDEEQPQTRVSRVRTASRANLPRRYAPSQAPS